MARSSFALALLLAAVLPSCGEEEANCEAHPGGCRCYYDALADGCPSAIGQDAQVAMCSCDYVDNMWLHVLSNFIWAFRARPEERLAMGQKFAVRFEQGGTLSMDVGYGERVQCGTHVAQAYPGTMFEASVDELHSFARNILWPEVRQKLHDICVPGRIALQLLCLHAELGVRDGPAAHAYAQQLLQLFPLIEGCVQKLTPWPFPGLAEYLQSWKANTMLADASPIDSADVPRLSWWPDRSLMRGKTPEESDGHYWPCVPLQDESCFPARTDSLHSSCENCCDPGKGPTGDSACFVGEWTFSRCCRTPGGSGRFY